MRIRNKYSTIYYRIRLSNEEKALAESYARIHNLSLGEAFKNALFEKIEDEYDLKIAKEAHDEYIKSGKKKPTYLRTFKWAWFMIYHVETTTRFDREFRKLDKYTQRMIKAWIEKNLDECSNSRIHGKGLTANRSGQLRYRIGIYRLICEIHDYQLIILALTIGHRREIYDQI